MKTTRRLSWWKKALLILLALVITLGCAWGLFYTHKSNPNNLKHYNTTNIHINHKTGISAHRSGAGIVPEETMMAFKYCVENSDFKIDYFEFDLHLTKDNELVLLHDDILDRTSNSEEVYGKAGTKANQKTLEELRLLNMGYKFEDGKGNYPYKDLSYEELTDDLRIATLDQVLDYLQSQDNYKYIIEIKDDGKAGKLAADKLYKNLKKRNLLESVLICSFHDDVLEYVDQVYPDASRGAGVGETAEFTFAAYLNKKDYEPKFDAVQLPYGDIKESYGCNLGLVSVINYAHSHDVAVQYWTINDREDMAYLASIGADLIMSDYPDILADVLTR